MTCPVCFNKGGSWLTSGVCQRCGRTAPNYGRPVKKRQKTKSGKKGNSGGGLIGLIILAVILFLLFGGNQS